MLALLFSRGEKACIVKHEVLNIDKLTYAVNIENLASIGGNERYTFVQEDICNQRNVAFNAII